jgi:hypothetical protein
MVCDDKQTDCPFFPGGKEYIHHAFDDPAACAGTDEEVLACFRRTRDEIKAWIEETFIRAKPGEPSPSGPPLLEISSGPQAMIGQDSPKAAGGLESATGTAAAGDLGDVIS